MRANVTPIAYCTWIDRMGAIGSKERGWHHFNGSDFVKVEPREWAALPIEHVCRASVGERIVTVWLPKGAMIRIRRPRASRDDGRYRHTYGRDRESGIVIYIPEAIRE